jgi:hypothetical protein
MAVRVQVRPAAVGTETKLVGSNRAWVVESDMDLYGRLVTVRSDVALAPIADL